MLNEFKGFLVRQGVLDEYCKALVELSGGYGLGVDTLDWDDVIDSMFSWEAYTKSCTMDVDWEDVNHAWREEYSDHHSFDDLVGFDTVDEFVKAIRGKSKKMVLLSRLQYVK